MTVNDYPQIGIGWSFPPRWAGGEVVTSSGTTHLEEAIRVILRTGIGSRVMRPTLGAGVDRYVFSPRTEEVCFRLATDVERALVLWEPRIIVDRVEAVPAGEADDRIDVTIEYRIDRHRRPTNLVVPFYLESVAS